MNIIKVEKEVALVTLVKILREVCALQLIVTVILGRTKILTVMGM